MPMQRALEKAGQEAEVIKIKHKGLFRHAMRYSFQARKHHSRKIDGKRSISGEIKKVAHAGIPIMATCAGLVLLAKKGDEQVKKTGQSLLSLMDITVNRNAFGRQKESLNALLILKVLNHLSMLFHTGAQHHRIRGKCGSAVRIQWCYYCSKTKKYACPCIPPELTDDPRIHHYFLKMIKK